MEIVKKHPIDYALIQKLYMEGLNDYEIGKTTGRLKPGATRDKQTHDIRAIVSRMRNFGFYATPTDRKHKKKLKLPPRHKIAGWIQKKGQNMAQKKLKINIAKTIPAPPTIDPVPASSVTLTESTQTITFSEFTKRPKHYAGLAEHGIPTLISNYGAIFEFRCKKAKKIG